ncbi:MAG: pilin [Zoogloeaceae bacterium]|nr:pilin [Zoogloeaceae bacterium]
MNDGRTVLGTGDSQCNPGYTCSTLMTGARTIPEACAQASSTGVPQITPVDNLGAAGTQIVTTFGNSAHGLLKSPAATITMKRSISGDWTCETANIPTKHIPAGCS